MTFVDHKNQPYKKISHHILPTSANLLGFTFIVLTTVKSMGLSQHGVTDNVAGVCVVLFSISTLLSFVSVSGDDYSFKTYVSERFAQWFFLAAVSLCTILALLLAFDVVNLGK